MGPKKKRKSKKQQKEEEMLAERLKREEAEEKARAEEARQKEEKKQRMEARMKEQREMLEQKVREEILSKITTLFKKTRIYHFQSKINQRKSEQWERFLKCDRLPYPESAPNMHTHLYHWKSLKETEFLENAMDQAETVLNILNVLDKLIEEPLDAPQNVVKNWKEIRNSYRFEILKKIDIGCFHLMKKITKNLNRVDFWTVDFNKSTENIKIGLWGWLDEPISEFDKRAPPSVEFKEIGIIIRLPVPYNRQIVLIRVIHTMFDHCSDTTHSWNEPTYPVEFDLMKAASKYYNDKEKLKEERELKEKLRKVEEEQRLLMQESESPPPPATEGSQLSVSDLSEEKEAKGSESLIEDESRYPTPTPELIYSNKLPNRAFDEILKSINENEEKPEKIPSVIEIQKQKQIKKTQKQMKKKYVKYLDLLCPLNKNDNDKNIKTVKDLILNFDKTKLEDQDKPSESSSKPQFDMSDFGKKEQIFQIRKPSMEKSLDEILKEREEEEVKKYNRALDTRVTQFELNLRKFCILGGVFYIDLIKHVPQEFELEKGAVVQMQFGEDDIIRDDFFFVYVPPKITEINEDDEDKAPPDDNIDKLIFVEVTLPQDVLWFEAPTIVLWDKTLHIWSNEHVYDIKFNEEKQVISCRIGKADPLGLAVIRYNNLPFQTWELRPEWNDRSTINLSLTASTVILEFLIKGKKVALQCLQNATSNALEWLIGEYYFPHELISIMKKAGVDLFPCNDTFLYVEGHCVKNPLIEEHVYLAMAMFANVYQFTWSRWNMQAGKNMIVYQMREALTKQNLASYQMVMTTLQQTAIVDCSEVSPSFSEKSIEENSFYPDLYSLLSSVITAEAKVELDKLDLDLIITVYEMLLRTKVFSFS